MQVEYIVVGQGLAGSVLAREAVRRGLEVAVIHDRQGTTAAEIAAGLINPITGPRLALTEQAATLVPWADRYYHALLPPHAAAQRCEVCRLFQSEAEVTAYEKRTADPGYVDYLGTRLTAGDAQAAGLLAPYGGVMLRQATMLRPADVLRVLHDEVAEKVVTFDERLLYEDLTVEADAVRWKSLAARHLVFCEGYAARANPWLSQVPFNHAKGERLLVEAPDLAIDQPVVSHGLHILPLGSDRYWVGGTYAWDDLSPMPTEQARRQIFERLTSLVAASVTVVDHAAAIRPITARRTPVLGRLPTMPSLSVFNGLGPKGFLRAPYYASQLLDHLVHQAPLDAEVDLQTHVKRSSA